MSNGHNATERDTWFSRSSKYSCTSFQAFKECLNDSPNVCFDLLKSLTYTIKSLEIRLSVDNTMHVQRKYTHSLGQFVAAHGYIYAVSFESQYVHW